MKVIVLGGYGHIGSYLVPKLVKLGYDVTAVSRGKREPYTQDSAWNKITHVSLDRKEDARFADKVADLNGDIVIDLISFTVEDTKKIIKSLKSTDLTHYLFCSSIWAHGRAETLPADPNGIKHPLDEYGINKYQSEMILKSEFLHNDFPATIIMPGQISGPAWSIINPLGNQNDQVFQDIADGKKLYLPNFGMETLHHVHADDVAQLFVDAITHRTQSLGQSFHAVSTESLTLYGYAQATYRFFDQEPKINFLQWDEWCEYVGSEADIDKSYYHIARSGQYSITNAQRLLGYQPKYTVLETIEECLRGYLDRGIIVR